MWANILSQSKASAHPSSLERVMGIEPTSSAWKAEVLPLNYTRLVEPPPILRSNDPTNIRFATIADQNTPDFSFSQAYKNPDSLNALTVRNSFLMSVSSRRRTDLISQPDHHLVEGVGFEPT